MEEKYYYYTYQWREFGEKRWEMQTGITDEFPPMMIAEMVTNSRDTIYILLFYKEMTKEEYDSLGKYLDDD